MHVLQLRANSSHVAEYVPSVYITQCRLSFCAQNSRPLIPILSKSELCIMLLQECDGSVETAVACFFSTQKFESASPEAQLCNILDNAVTLEQVHCVHPTSAHTDRGYCSIMDTTLHGEASMVVH